MLQWAASYPHRVFAALPIAGSTRHSAQNIAFHEVGRQAVMADPDWRGGRYFAEALNPRRGLAVARMGAHITYLSDAALHRKFGRRFQNRDNPTFSFDADFQVESYLRHQGITFVERFDANSYLYLTRAMDYFDLAADYDGVVAEAFRGAPTRFCVISFTSDWLFPTAEPSCTRSTPPARGSHLPKSPPTRATTRFCSMSQNCSLLCVASSRAPRRRAGCRCGDYNVVSHRSTYSLSPWGRGWGDGDRARMILHGPNPLTRIAELVIGPATSGRTRWQSDPLPLGRGEKGK